MPEKKIYTKWLAYKLRTLGHKIIRTEVNPEHPEFDVWVFVDTPKLQNDLTNLTQK